MRVLYITHYGILEPLGQSQILPYLTGLAGRGHSIDILSFEKLSLSIPSAAVEAQSSLLRPLGIRWYPRSYRPGASLHHLLADIIRASLEIARRCACDGIDLIHCRSHIPFIMAWYASVRWAKPMIFDFRGFLAEECVDSGLWKPNGFRFRITKALERRMARKCAALVVLTDPARDHLQSVYSLDEKKLFVIPCCVDLARFGCDNSQQHPYPGRPLKVIYIGSTTGRYNVSEMLRFFSILRARRPGSQFTILSSNDPTSAQARLGESGLPAEAVSVQSVPPDRVPEILARQDLGLIFVRGDLALLAASPTKLGQYLACGLVVVAEKGIGGLDNILVNQGAGCLVDSQRPDTWGEVVERALYLCDQADFRQKSREIASRFYSLSIGVDSYAKAYAHALAT
jgi:glycosyltransferase involved in cell wall biosynthesis